MRSIPHPNVLVFGVQQHPPPLPRSQPVVQHKIRSHFLPRVYLQSYQLAYTPLHMRYRRDLLIEHLRRIMVCSTRCTFLLSYPLGDSA